MSSSFDIVRLGSTEFIKWIERNSKKTHYTPIKTITDITAAPSYRDSEVKEVDFTTSQGKHYTTISFSEFEEYLSTPVKAFV